MFGFAAGCAAPALPRRRVALVIRAAPFVRARPFGLGQSPNTGHSPKAIKQLPGRGKPRPTSGGKAVLVLASLAKTDVGIRMGWPDHPYKKYSTKLNSNRTQVSD